jgi:hypothetical protein
MKQFNASGCCGLFAMIGQRTQIASIASNPKSVQDILAAAADGRTIQDEVPEAQLDDLRTWVLVPAMVFCAEAELRESEKKIKDLVNVQFANSKVTTSELQWALHELQRLMRSEMVTRKFFSIPEKFAELFDDPYPMLKEVSDAFPDAQYDIKEAYNCLVLDRNTAAVFHSMRVAEHGLRFVARKLKVSLTHNGKPQPIDTATWDKVINAVRSKIAHAHSMPHGSRRQKSLSYYADMADRCSYVKDIWRNDVMHSRRSYLADEAAAAIQRVAAFMKLLAMGVWGTIESIPRHSNEYSTFNTAMKTILGADPKVVKKHMEADKRANAEKRKESNPKTRDRYKGCVIQAKAIPLKVGNGYSACGWIETHRGDNITFPGEFQVSGIFTAELDAIAASFEEGRKIIDERIP